MKGANALEELATCLLTHDPAEVEGSAGVGGARAAAPPYIDGH